MSAHAIPPEIKPPWALQAVDLVKTFIPKKQQLVCALDHISINVAGNRITGLVGPDGAGKTTLLRLAAGLLLPSSGAISVLEHNCASESLVIQELVGYMPQQFGLYQDLTVQENLDLFSDLQGVAKEQRRHQQARLLDMTDLAAFTQRRVGKLSGGMKQKLGLACALIKAPQLLLLDEPTVGVDPVSRRELWTIIEQLVHGAGIGVLVATSYLDEAEHCDEVVVLQQGHVLTQGNPADLRQAVKGRVYSFTALENNRNRQLQTLLATQPTVRDATIRSGRVRCVISADYDQPIAQLIPANTYHSVTADLPCFEDAFMDMTAHRLTNHPETRTAISTTARNEVVVTVRDLGKKFGDFNAVSGISFDVHRGEIFGLLGPNGAGKTTTFRMLCGLSKASSGDIRVADRDLRRAPSKARSQLGYMAQVFSLYRQLSVKDNLTFYGKAYGLHGKHLSLRLDWALDEFDLRERSAMPAGDLPGGFKQRLAMATAMLHEPAILFLDEPTSGADPLARREFWLRINSFAQQGVTVIVTTHFMEEAEYCDRMLIMAHGRELAQGTPAEIRALVTTAATPDPTIEDAFIALAGSSKHVQQHGAQS